MLSKAFCKVMGFLSIACCCSLVFATQTLSEQRSLYLKAQRHLQTGKIQAFHQLLPKLTGYVLYPYLKYGDLKRKIHRVSLDELKEFERHYHDTPLVEKLQKEWLFAKAKSQRWQDFLRVYEHNENLSLQCHYLNAKYYAKADVSVFKQVPGIWLQGKSLPKACDALFTNWEKEISISRSLIWQRIKLAITEANFSLARYLAQNLSKRESLLVELWIKVHKNPSLIQKTHLFRDKHPAIMEMVLHGVSEIAKKQPSGAISLWRKISKHYHFNQRHWGIIVREIGLSLAKKRDSKAQNWLRKIPDAYLTKNVYEWGVRCALIKEDWKSVSDWISKMPQSLKEIEKWQYWYARSLEHTGHPAKAVVILNKLAQVRNYYGFLASLRAQKPYPLHHQSVRVPATLLKQIARLPAIKRAKELEHLGKSGLAQIEWRKALNKMTELERQAAAKLAFSWNLPNWSIVALSKAENKDNLELRFPKNHAQHIFLEARKHGIDPAWIFAVTRQESAFVSQARSRAGALGLMQMIPSTAKEVAKKMNMPFFGHTELFKAKKNISIGSAYLKMLLDKNNNNAVLATASYNAGPNRVAQWIPEKTVSADTWIETIPYKETRNYVKNVLSYTIIYQQLLGHEPILQNHLPLIIVGKSERRKMLPGTFKLAQK